MGPYGGGGQGRFDGYPGGLSFGRTGLGGGEGWLKSSEFHALFVTWTWVIDGIAVYDVGSTDGTAVGITTGTRETVISESLSVSVSVGQGGPLSSSSSSHSSFLGGAIAAGRTADASN